MSTTNLDQAAYWGQSESGLKWLTFEDQLDANHAPVLDLVLDRAQLEPGMRVLDIGCGTGASVLAAADRVGPMGHVTGADISEPFLDRATQRASMAGVAHVQFTLADAQVFDFPANSYDAVISRFGMMFFEDSRTAFTNIARAVRPGGMITFAAWGLLQDNPWFRLTHKIAAQRLGSPPKLDPHAPGPLAFQDLDRVSDLMIQAGLQVETAQAVPLHLTPQGRVDDVVNVAARVGPAARIMTHFEGTPEDADAIAHDLTQAFRVYETDDGLRIPALINLFQARVI